MKINGTTMQGTKQLVLTELTRDPDSARAFLAALSVNISIVVRAQLSENLSVADFKRRIRDCNDLLNRTAPELRNLILDSEMKRSPEQIAEVLNEVLSEVIERTSISVDLIWAIKKSQRAVASVFALSGRRHAADLDEFDFRRGDTEFC
jgi:hypothetical protein